MANTLSAGTLVELSRRGVDLRTQALTGLIARVSEAFYLDETNRVYWLQPVNHKPEDAFDAGFRYDLPFVHGDDFQVLSDLDQLVYVLGEDSNG